MVKHPHTVLLGPPRDIATWPSEGCGAPVILQRSDDDFIPAVLAALREPAGRSALRAHLAQPATLAAGTDTRAPARRSAARRLLDGLRARTERRAQAVAPPIVSPHDKAAAAAPAAHPAHTLDTLRQSLAGQSVLKLFQPIQRQFHLAVMEARCDTPGLPRIDPAKVTSAGLVIRRLRVENGREIRQGWMHAADGVRGWVTVDSDDAPLPPRHDPDAGRRLQRPGTGQPALDRERLALLGTQAAAVLSEDEVPMFVAPPDVCTAAGATLLYGLVPTTSSERAEGGAPVFDEDGFGAGSSAFSAHLVGALRGQPDSFPRPGRTLSPALADIARSAGDTDQAAMQRLLLLLRQLAVEFGAFEDCAEADALMQVLDDIGLARADAAGKPVAGTVPAGAFLRAATAILLDGDTPPAPPAMPLGWPELDARTRQRLAQALHACLLRRFEALSGQAGRYDDQDAHYVLRAFVRLKPEGSCPARTVWSAYSPRFVIAPWYEGGGAPPIQVAMPDPTDKATLRKLKPNVAFALPASMQHLMSGDPLELMKGKKPAGEGTGIGWLCGFNIPIITICAFIVLNIFLSLFDLFLRWMMFIKVCIPFPKKGGNDSDGGGG